jgi:hypothetical protein
MRSNFFATTKTQNAAAAELWKKTVRGKRGKPTTGFPLFPPPLEIPHNPRDSPFSHSSDCCWYLLKTIGKFVCR